MSNRKKVSVKKKRKEKQMWAEQFFYKLEELEKRIELLEEFLGGIESIKKVLKDAKS